MKRSSLSPHARDVLSICEVHLRSDELGMIAAALLKETRLSSVLREFKECLSADQIADLVDYLSAGTLPGGYWIWQEPLIIQSEEEAIEDDRRAAAAAELVVAQAEVAQAEVAQAEVGEQPAPRKARRKRG